MAFSTAKLKSYFQKEQLRNSLPGYLAVFFTPVLLLGALLLVNLTGILPLFDYLIPQATIPVNGLAAVCFLFYLRHTDRFTLSDHWKYLVSIAYGMCSFGVLQEKHLSVLIVYAVFPFVFYSYERMLSFKTFRPFILSASIILCLSPDACIPVFLLLFLLALIELELKGKLSFGNFLHITGCFLLVDLVSAFRILSYLAPSYTEHAEHGYQGFRLIQDILPFLSRFLPGVAPSGVFFLVNDSIDLFFGIAFLLLFFSCFFQKGMEIKRRISYLIFSLLLLGTVEISPVKYVFQLFQDPGKSAVSYGFFVVFWCLLLACHALSALADSPVSLLCAGTLTLAVATGAFLGSAHNFDTRMLIAIFVLTCVYTLLLLYLSRDKKTKAVFAVLTALILVEFFANGAVSSAEAFYQPGHSTLTQLLWSDDDSSAIIAASTVSSPLSQEEFLKWKSSHTDEALDPMITSLYDTFSQKTSLNERISKSDHTILDYFETTNLYFRKTGFSSNFFTKEEITPVFEESPFYHYTNLGNQLHAFTICSSETTNGFLAIPFHLNSELTDTATNAFAYHMYVETPTYTYDCLLDEDILNSKEPCYLPVSLDDTLSLNIRILFASYSTVDLPVLFTHYSDFEEDTPSLAVFDYSGVVISLIGIFLLFVLFFNSDKDKIHHKLYAFKEAADAFTFLHNLKKHLSANAVYYLSFALPFLMFIIQMICTDSMPFGQKSIFDSDGAALTLPTYLDYYYNLQQGNTSLTLNAGYGSSMYASNPSMYLFFFLRMFKASQIPVLLMFSEALFLGLSGLFMTVYMTHRLKGEKGNKNDFRLLIAAMIYSMNGYMLSIHSFPNWFFVLSLFPLVMLGLDRLMIQKKWLLYILSLAVCMIFHIQLGLYMCIFLFVIFFTYRFEDLKDFIRKGIHFAIASLLSAGIGFYTIACTLSETTDSVYDQDDSVFPHIGLHTSFFEQWKKLMPFSYTDPVSSDNGTIALYLGILTLFFVIIYFMSKKYTLKQKICKLIPISFLLLSFNGQVLSYIWNGLHYQIKMPNRFVFLLAFMISELAFDGFLELDKVSFKKSMIYLAVLTGAFVIFQYGSTGIPKASFIGSMVLCLLYGIVILWNKYQNKNFKVLSILLTLFLILEMSANMFHTIRSYGTSEINFYEDYASVEPDINSTLFNDTDFARICYPSSDSPNVGMALNTPSGSIFNSYVTNHQATLNRFFGFYNNVNCSTANYDSTPFGNMLAGNRYLFVHNWQYMPLKDLDNYDYLGSYSNYYIYENKKALSLGYYAPSDIQSVFGSPDYPALYNAFVKRYTGDDRNLFEICSIVYDETRSCETDNSFYFTDASDRTIDFAEAEEIFDNTATIMEPVSTLYLKVRLSSQTSGQAYLYTDEPAAIGPTTAGESTYFTTIMPDKNFKLSRHYTVLVMNQDVLNDFYDCISKKQMTNITFGNDQISGTTDYSEDGYTMFSLAYSRNWHAYIDGKKVAIEDPLNSCLMVKTPAGKHTITLKYVPYGMKECRIVSLLCLLLTLGLYFGGRIFRKKKRGKIEIDI